MEILTIGFTKKTARQFFDSLKQNNVKQLIDVRLNNVSQLSGFAKKEDLSYFLSELCGASYIHKPLLAPTQAMLDEYKKEHGGWLEYRKKFLQLIADRTIEKSISPDLFSTRTVLLCSELTAEHCHRGLVVEYLREHWGSVDVKNI